MLLSIRRAKKEDLNQVYAIELLSFKNPYPKYLFDSFLSDSSILFLVCLSYEELIGYIIASLKNRSGHIISLAVHPKFRRKGVGSTLLREILNLMKKAKILFVKLEVNESNVAAISFYKKHGFKFVKEIKNYYEGGLNALLFYKSLTEEINFES
ncbi:ribosomal protein S18-alanine N-acetyltransferase [Candidatus Bathyarchaeota archaeon]|nr:ribosomal protein S18-alanine N-acetyltransferase [Candidatus Bathyarchaeota archaeon]